MPEVLSLKSTESKLRIAGADKIILPNVVGGNQMASMMLNPLTTMFFEKASMEIFIDDKSIYFTR